MIVSNMDEVLTRAFSLLGALMGENAISLTSAKSGLTVLALNDELNQSTTNNVIFRELKHMNSIGP